MQMVVTGFLCSITEASNFTVNNKIQNGQQEQIMFFVDAKITDAVSIWSIQAMGYSNVYYIKKDMKNLQILVLFVLLAATLSLRLHEQKKVAPSEEEYEEAPKKTAPSKAPAKQEEPAPKAANTKKPAAKAEEEEQPEKPAAKPKPAKAEPAAEKAEPTKAEKAEPTPAKSAASDSSSAAAVKSLTPEELKQFTAWKDSLIPLAPFESGKDNTNALDAQLEKLTLAKIEEIKKKSESK